jgi:dihydrofolate reductase
MREFYSTIDAIPWGRRTYEWLLKYSKNKGKTKGLVDPKMANYVFSRKPPRRPAPGFEFVTEPVKAFAQHLLHGRWGRGPVAGDTR